MTNQSSEDTDLQALLARDSDISRAWQATSAEEPSVALNDALRAAARRAVSAGPGASGSSFVARWRVPLSIAALLVVSASLTLLVSEERQHLPGMTSRDLPRAVPPQPAEANIVPGKRDEEARQVGSPRALSDSAVLSQPADKAARPGRVSGAMSGATSKATAPAPQATAVTPEAIAPAADRVMSEPQVAAPARSDSPSVGAGARANAELKQGLPSGRELPSQPATQSEVMSKRKFEQVAPAPQSPEADSTAPRAPPARATAGAQLQGRAAPAKESAAEENLAPAVWIERILDLRREGKVKEAADSLEAFRHRYPDFPLPQELSAPR